MLLAFDYDGTLAPIVSDPLKAHMRKSTRNYLSALAQRFPCAILTGRSVANVKIFLKGIPLVAVIGNHGLEPASISGVSAKEIKSLTNRVRTWEKTLTYGIRNLKGVYLENKRFSLTLHYRTARNRKQTEILLIRAVRSLKGATLIHGKEVINILPSPKYNKGTALLKLMKKKGYPQAVYVGDDLTDESVFQLPESHGILTFVIGKKQSHAQFYIPDGKIDSFLKLLLRFSQSV